MFAYEHRLLVGRSQPLVTSSDALTTVAFSALSPLLKIYLRTTSECNKLDSGLTVTQDTMVNTHCRTQTGLGTLVDYSGPKKIPQTRSLFMLMGKLS